MIPKVSLKTERTSTHTLYVVKSKSLTAALGRAMLLVEALEGATVEIEHLITDKNKHKVLLHVS